MATLSDILLQQVKSAAGGVEIPSNLGKLSGFIKDQDGDGDIDLQDILIVLKGGGQSNKAASVLGIAGSLLGGFLKK